MRIADDKAGSGVRGRCTGVISRVLQRDLRDKYDRLRAKERQIFLDITCFFKGMYLDYGTEAVEGIFLDRSQIGEVDLSPKVFKKMHSLRLLKIDDKIKSKLKFSEGLQCLPDALRCLNWYYYPLRSLPSKFSPHNLVELEMPYCKLKQLWNGVQELHLINCTRLMNLSTTICELKHLRDLSLLRCSELENFPEILEPVESLRSLDLRETGITGLPRFFACTLFLDDCENLAFVPHSIFCISSLQKLSLSNCPRVELLAAMSQICLHRLKEPNMSNCSALELPDWFGSLSSLETLDLR
ncbi:Leucine-rich repeat [Parasponia andersonii]|uniref:Leucine-rich repeat n=1 Tax=Parasponia andersonii TaxID=3476 RepID=A0A2P5ABG4_PARAD|nr:Leucine-rich repeat [Parasponia andersonii]